MLSVVGGQLVAAHGALAAALEPLLDAVLMEYMATRNPCGGFTNDKVYEADHTLYAVVPIYVVLGDLDLGKRFQRCGTRWQWTGVVLPRLATTSSTSAVVGHAPTPSKGSTATQVPNDLPEQSWPKKKRQSAGHWVERSASARDFTLS